MSASQKVSQLQSDQDRRGLIGVALICRLACAGHFAQSQ